MKTLKRMFLSVSFLALAVGLVAPAAFANTWKNDTTNQGGVTERGKVEQTRDRGGRYHGGDRGSRYHGGDRGYRGHNRGYDRGYGHRSENRSFGGYHRSTGFDQRVR